jgi:hypothetical protein
VLVAEFGSVLEVFKVHVVFRHEFKGARGCRGDFTRALLGHALHGVDVAEGCGVADVAVESSAIERCEEMFGLFVDHRDSELLIKRGVAM